MVISVITLNSWIYFTEPEKEIVQNKEPTPNPEPTYSPTPEIQITAVEEKTPTPTPTSTPRPTPTPTPTPKPTPRVLPIKTPIVKVSPTITPTPIKCNVKQETAIIKNSYASFFRSKINQEKGDIFAQYLKGRQDRSAVELSTNINDLNISVANDCQTAKAIYPYIWVIYP